MTTAASYVFFLRFCFSVQFRLPPLLAYAAVGRGAHVLCKFTALSPPAPVIFTAWHTTSSHLQRSDNFRGDRHLTPRQRLLCNAAAYYTGFGRAGKTNCILFCLSRRQMHFIIWHHCPGFCAQESLFLGKWAKRLSHRGACYSRPPISLNPVGADYE